MFVSKLEAFIKSQNNEDELAYSFDHSAERYTERYGKLLTREKFDNYNKEIRSFVAGDFKDRGKYSLELVSKHPGSKVTTYTIKITDEDNSLFVSFEVQRSSITTILPPESIKYGKK